MRIASAPSAARGSASWMFSATVSDSNSAKCWNTMPMPSSRAAAAFANETAAPFHSMLPVSGRVMPQMMRDNVLLPEPFSPSNAWISPGMMARSMPSLAWMSP